MSATRFFPWNHRRPAALLLAIRALLAACGPAPALGQESDRSACADVLEVLVERAFAGNAGLAVGDTFSLGPDPSTACRATVAGTFEPPPDPATLTRGRPRVLFHLPDLARLTDRVDEADRFTLSLAPGADPERVAARIEYLMPGVQALSADRLAEESSATFEVIQRFHRAIAWITLGATGVFLVCVMTLRIQQRRTPIAAMRLAGISRASIAGWLMLESTLIAVGGGAAGLLIGRLASVVINRFYQARYDTTLLFSIVGPESLIPSLVLAVVLGLGAGAAALLFIFQSDPLREVGR